MGVYISKKGSNRYLRGTCFRRKSFYHTACTAQPCIWTPKGRSVSGTGVSLWFFTPSIFICFDIGPESAGWFCSPAFRISIWLSVSILRYFTFLLFWFRNRFFVFISLYIAFIFRSNYISFIRYTFDWPLLDKYIYATMTSRSSSSLSIYPESGGKRVNFRLFCTSSPSSP